MYKIQESPLHKNIRSPNYNFNFNKKTGMFVRWGSTPEDDPVMAPGPEILDLEISYGNCIGCDFCYKGNGIGNGVHNLTLDEFKVILSKMPKTLTQIAFGITNINTNPDFVNMMKHSRASGIIPNYTCNGYQVTPEVAQMTSEVCGAVAISVYNKEVSYDAIKLFTDAGMTQVNIHFMLSVETFDKAKEIVNDATTDDRLKGLRAIVFLGYKAKGTNRGQFESVKDVEMYKSLIKLCEEKKIGYGFDSCSAPMYYKIIEGTPTADQMAIFGEACEATCFSSYINADGKFFPCSFNEGEGDWVEGIDVLNCNNFVDDVWNNPKTEAFRDKLLGTTKGCTNCPSQKYCRNCPTFEVTSCHKG